MIDGIITKLRELRLPVMAAALTELYEDKGFSRMSSLEVLDKVISEEYLSQKNHTIEKRLLQAKLTDRQARLEMIDYRPEREINHALIDQLSTNEYISNGRNIIILGATGCGKSYISNALANSACQSGYRVRYTRMTELMSDLMIARAEGTIRKVMKQIEKVDLLIIDDFLLVDTTLTEQKDLMEIFEFRGRGYSTILCSQLSESEWHSKLGGGHLADAILDRIVNNSYRIILKGNSMRKK